MIFNLSQMMYVWSPIKILHLNLIKTKTWPPMAIFVSDWLKY